MVARLIGYAFYAAVFGFFMWSIYQMPSSLERQIVLLIAIVCGGGAAAVHVLLTRLDRIIQQQDALIHRLTTVEGESLLRRIDDRHAFDVMRRDHLESAKRSER